MVEFFTVLIIDYHINSYDALPLAYVVYSNEDHCQQALDRGLADPVYDDLMHLYGNDIMMFCHVTDQVSKTMIRPRARPSDYGE